MSTTTQSTSIDPDRLQELLGRFVGDLGAGLTAPLVLIGDRLGLYRALAEGGAQTSEELADRTALEERYVREWLANQAASGYVEYDPGDQTFHLTAEQAACLAGDDGPTSIPGAFNLVGAAHRDLDRIEQAFKTGDGVGWHEHDHALFCGTERFFRAGYQVHLVDEWLPALDGVVAKLEQGASVADVGCGHGASTILMAEAYPQSSFVGFDYHDASIETAREAAAVAGLADRVAFEVAPAASYPGGDYDLVCMFDCLHDMGDPVGAARHVRDTLAPGGSWMVVEPIAGDTLEANVNPVGRIFYAASAQICTPASRSQEVGLALGAQAGEARLSEVIREGGLSTVRRVAETPFNMVLEAKA